MTDENSILKGLSPQSEPDEKKNTKIHDLTRPGSNLRPIASTTSYCATVVRALIGRKYWMYTWRIFKAEAGIIENNSYNQEPLVKILSLTCLSVQSLLILIKKLKISFLSLGL